MIRNSRPSELIEIVKNNPGIRFREVMRTTGIKNGSLSYLIKKLEYSKKINIERKPKQTRLFPLYLNNDKKNIIKALRGYTTREILIALLNSPEKKLSLKDVNAYVRRARSTLSHFMSKLVDDQIVRVEFDESKKVFRLIDPISIYELFDLYHPGILERATSGFEDVVNSL